MTCLEVGEIWYDPQLEQELTIQEDIDTFGMDVAEMNRLIVKVTTEEGTTMTVPHERFRGRRSYEYVGKEEEASA
jgi:hypothetical protein